MDGLIYYNAGYKCLVRLAVSISTLVQYYNGNVTVLADEISYDECLKITKFFDVDCIETEFDADREKNWVLLNKCRLHEKTPYDRTILLDADTIVLKDISDAFKYLDNTTFIVTQMSNWLSTDRICRKRIKGWEKYLPDRIYYHVFGEPKAVNTGFYGWVKGAGIFNDWCNTAKLNRLSFIPDELACQILLPHYDHLVIPSEYNTSCKHEELTDKSRTIHYHGRKHCRIQDGKCLHHSDLWYNAFNCIKELPFVRNNIQHDRMLTKNIGLYNDS